MKLCSVKLNDGFLMPMLGLGTSAPSKVAKSDVEEAVMKAIDVGYRHFDSAYFYLNEEEIGRAIWKKIADGSVKREDIFYTSKAMERCKDAGLAKSIGVSNFNRKQLERILNKPGLKYKPVCNQVECHPYLNQSKLLEFCKSQDIVLTAYAALGSNSGKEWVSKNNPVLLEDPVLNAIAARHRRTPAQVALRYQLQRGVVALAKSFNPKRIQENFQVLDFQLTPEDMDTLDGLNRNMRYFVDTVCPRPTPFSLCRVHRSTRNPNRTVPEKQATCWLFTSMEACFLQRIHYRVTQWCVVPIRLAGSVPVQRENSFSYLSQFKRGLSLPSTEIVL
ncbi:aldo-keto reductase family 1 member C1 homolog isoform X5 [Suricata suricatta]|uniref:aldo-keto reductase family 1 member C1 homolog isoform X5 n=1 Tax=Suricata suricatta TaxID=37032 RepID=UPI001155E8E6|nr:aldo-keto reductase family 1 member C1 homolog isoform X5 [Suricata suricatta]